MDAGAEIVGLDDRSRCKTLAKKDACGSKYKLLFFWFNVLFKYFHYQLESQTDLWKVNLQCFRARVTTQPRYSGCPNCWTRKESGMVSMLITKEGYDSLVMCAMDVGGKSRNLYTCST